MDTLSQWIQQHSFLLLVCASLLGSLFQISWFRLWTRRSLMIWGSAAVLAVVLLVALRTPAATVSETTTDDVLGKTNGVNSAVSTDRLLDFSSTGEIEAYLQEGQKPTLVEFYSDFGIGWMLVIPVVDRIAEMWTAGRTLRLNLVVEVNKDYAESLGVVDTPTFILFDDLGREQGRWVGDAPTMEELPK